MSMLLPMFFWILACVIYSTSTETDSPQQVATANVQISPSGFNFFSDHSQKTLAENFHLNPLSTMVTPRRMNSTITPGGWLKLGQIITDEFLSPKVTVRPAAGGYILLNSMGGTIGIRGTWHANYTSRIPFLASSQSNGTYTVTTKNIPFWMKLEPVVDFVGVLVLRIVSCRESIRNYEVFVHVGGPITDKLVHYFSRIIDADFRTTLQKQICDHFAIGIGEINYKLAKYQTSNPLSENLIVQYNNIRAKVDERDKVFAINGLINVQLKNKMCNLSNKWINVDKSPPTTHEFMMTIWLSESPLNCFLDGLYHTYHRDWMQRIDRSTPILGDYLSTSCNTLRNCMGSFVPGLSKHFPNTIVNFDIIFVHSPSIRFTKNAAGILLSGHLNVKMRLASTGQVLVAMNVIGNITLAPYIVRNRISAMVFGTPSADITVIKSLIGPEATNSSVWERLLHHLQPIIIMMMGERLAEGLPLPTLSGVRIFSAHVVFSDGQVRISADLTDAAVTSEEESQLSRSPSKY